jgi:queuine tRNA-ribosyltransferase
MIDIKIDNNSNKFTLIKEDNNSKARAGLLQTDRGVIETPIFMPVGTQGTVKTLEQRVIKELKAQIILGNTYHLYLRPGNEVLESFGGLHKFMNWDMPILTDSGGYQVFSLQEIRKINKDGVEFRSHIDGSKHLFTPENVVDTQRTIGSDIMMVLDECVPYPAEEKYTKDSAKLSIDWAKRCLVQFKNTKPKYGFEQQLFAIIQGGMYKQHREDYCKEITQYDFNAFAIGGLSVGEPAELMYELTEVCTDLLPKDRARYLMGVGTPENILESIERGVDMFDCVMPTRNARNGQIFTTRGKINVRNAKYKFSQELIDAGLDNYTSNNYTLGYLRHLTITDEVLGLILATQQNIAFYLWLVKTAREKIINGEFTTWKKEFLTQYNSKD